MIFITNYWMNLLPIIIAQLMGIKISVSKDLKERIPESRLGLIIATVFCKPSSAKLLELMDEQVREIQSKYVLEEINKLDVIASARDAYKKCRNDPNRYRPSADALLRRIVKGSRIYKINNIVDVLNLISVQSGFSIGGYDLFTIEGDVVLGIGEKDEEYYGIGRGMLNINNLPVLRDRKGAFGTPTSDSERTMITNSTRKILFIFFDFGKHDSLQKYMNLCSNLLIQHCDAEKMKLEIINFFQ